jgi:hypothetical protein
VARESFCAWWLFGDEGTAMAEDLFGEGGVGGWVDLVDPTGKHGYGTGSRGEGSDMGSGVDAEGETRVDRGRDGSCRMGCSDSDDAAELGHVASANDGDAGNEGGWVTFAVEQDRGMGGGGE